METASLAKNPTEPAGEPMHAHFTLRRLATPAANDCRTLLAYDEEDILTRLSVEPIPATAVGPFDGPSDLPAQAESLLKAAVKDAPAVKTLTEQPNVSEASTWIRLFRAKPIRLAVLRVARQCDARVHAALGHKTIKMPRHSRKRCGVWFSGTVVANA